MIQTAQAVIREDIIDLSLGHPTPELLPLDVMRRAAEESLAGENSLFLQYGFEQGDGFFRRALAKLLSEEYGVPVNDGQLFVTNGVSQALDLICTLFTRPGDLIFVEEPSYFLALRIFADHGLKTQCIPTDENGLVIEALEEELKGNRAALLYTIPTHQNPTGTTMPETRRRRLADLSRKHDFLILADEVYHLLTYDGNPPSPFASLMDRGNVLSLGSFSKILAPGLRLGWIQGTEKPLEKLVTCGMLDSGGGLNPFTSALIREALELGLQKRHLEHLRTVYAKRLEATGSALQKHLSGFARYHHPRGGFFYWLELPENVDTERLLQTAEDHKMSFVPGFRFSSREGLRNCLRLSFSYFDEKAMAEGVRRLAGALQQDHLLKH